MATSKDYFPYYVFEMDDDNGLSLRYGTKIKTIHEAVTLIHESIESNIFEMFPLSTLRFSMEEYMDAIKQQTDTKDFNPMGLTINPKDNWLIFVDEEGRFKHNNLNHQASQFFGSPMFGSVMLVVEKEVEIVEIEEIEVS